MSERTFTLLVERLRDHDPVLFPTGVWNESLDKEIADMVTSELAPDRSQFDLAYGLAVKAGLHLWNESLHRSHILSQDVHNATGSYWHGIMHRMEGDYDNAKYWLERVGKHPIHSRLQFIKSDYIYDGDWEGTSSRELRVSLHQFYLQRSWDSLLFVDLVQGVVTSGRELRLEKAVAALQKQEIIMLLEFSYRNACGGQILEPFNR
ncbi:MAG: hypothetical protein K0R57_1780 [Paenibacillaceae bacterium]|jgi:hypothetical protein|nr:hypothetical protein [Paenibacillaceae bacterium]